MRSLIQSKNGLAACAVLVAALLSGCTGTKVIDTWRDEAYTGRPARILVIAITRERGPRTLLEEGFARQLKVHGVEPYIGTAAFPEEGLPSRDAVIAKAAELKAEAVLVVRFLQTTTGETSTPVRRYAAPAGFATSWNDYLGSYYGASTMTAVGIRDVSYDFYYATIETTLFDMQTQDPLWSLYSSTKYEQHLLKQIDPFAETIMRELDKAKLLPRR